MYKLRICISWMDKNVILLPTPMYVDAFIIGEREKLSRVEKACVIIRTFM